MINDIVAFASVLNKYEGIELLKCCQVYAAGCVSKKKTILSITFYSIYRAVCLQLTQFSCDDRENVYFNLLSPSNRKYESLTIV